MTSIGLVSDTHLPERCRELPAALFEVLADVDLILHAGDVGEPSVLDNLTGLAPVIAVRGNDDSEWSYRSLPYTVVVACAGTRILLWHSHYEDRREEVESRQGDDFGPKLARISRKAHEAGAGVAVFGHWHVPLVREVGGITLINPGAVASGNVITRQLRQTVARLEVNDGGMPTVRHYDLAEPDRAFDPAIEWEAGFKAALDRYSSSILSVELLDRLPSILSRISDEEQVRLRPIVLRLARRCWEGELNHIDSELLRGELARQPTLSSVEKERYNDLLA